MNPIQDARQVAALAAVLRYLGAGSGEAGEQDRPPADRRGVPAGNPGAAFGSAWAAFGSAWAAFGRQSAMTMRGLVQRRALGRGR